MHEVTSVGAPAIALPRSGKLDPDDETAAAKPGTRVVYAGPVGARAAYVVATPQLVAHVYDPATDRWTTVTGGTPPAQYDHLFSFAGGERLVLAWQGPRNEQVVHAEVLDAAGGTLRSIPRGPATFHGLVEVIGDALYVWPGTKAATYPPPLDFAHGMQLDFATSRWSALPPGPATATVQAHAVTGGRLFVWTREGTAAIFDAHTLVWHDVSVPERMQADAYAWRDRVAVIGTASDGPHHVYVYDVAAGAWHPADHVPDLAPGPGWVTTEHVGPYLVTIKLDHEGYAFDLETATWSTVPAAPPQVTGRAVPAGDRALGFLGANVLAVLDIPHERWCLTKVDIPALAADEHVLAWGGATLGVWGALDRVPPPACPRGAPCMNRPEKYTGRAIGSVIRW